MKTNSNLGDSPWKAGAFTLIELLVVIAVIGILAGLLLPVLASAKRRAAQATCINNVKQLGTGMKMYVDDNNNAFPGIASRQYGYHPADWIYWRTNTALYPAFVKSPILVSLPGMQQPSLRCPLDVSDTDRNNYSYPDGYGPYLFSYSMTGYGLNGDDNVGMSTVVANNSDGTVTTYPFKEGAVKNPAGKIMLAEEPGSLAAWDNPTGNAPINDGRWVPSQDPLTIRHGGKADVTFTDGHVEPVAPDFGGDTANSEPDL
jgi:prepilin-type N-terminal cleavage/methylation domain-containing protein/prepilin-type processing-associated H-X9-DG protein